jgi:hypothetical protein
VLRLPPHAGPLPDVDGFIRQLRTCILPPRPSSGPTEADIMSAATSLPSMGPNVGMKRGIDGAALPAAAAPAGGKDDEDDEEDEDPAGGGRDDVFRQRSRARLAQ